MQVNITFPPVPPPPPPPNVRTLRKWSELTHPLDLKLFSSGRGQPEGQTQGQQSLFTPYLLKGGVWAGTWGANQNSPEISNTDWLRIASMQTADTYTIADKMNHLTNGGSGTWGQALQAKYEPSANWQAATNIKINQCVYAGNQVEILERKTMTIDTFGTVSLVRIKTGWDQVHVYTAVTAANFHYWEVKGKIVLPLLPKAGYDWFLLERWLL